jgi:hypothetical protein
VSADHQPVENLACLQAYPGSLKYGHLNDCAKTGRHWKHQNSDGSIKWWGGDGLTDDEKAEAQRLRDLGHPDYEKAAAYFESQVKS